MLIPSPVSANFLTWDEQSYLDTKGARAIDLEQTDDQTLRYCTLSGETMATSHVWSHGQWGRPETGFNICLHRRYQTLARSLGCTSYWMDTPCIPTDDTLRDEAIGQINDNFTSSKVTLLVDRDLIEIDIHPLTLEAEEAILSTLVVCDWNVRGWTLLEDMRGRLKLHLLCNNDHIISLIDVLNDVTAKSNLSPLWFSLQSYSGTAAYYRVYNEGADARMDLSGRMNLRSIIGGLLKKHRWVALLQPALRGRGTTGSVAPPRPFGYQGEANGPLLVVVASDDGQEWVWQFVHEWNVKFQLPEFSLEEILIV